MATTMVVEKCEDKTTLVDCGGDVVVGGMSDTQHFNPIHHQRVMRRQCQQQCLQQQPRKFKNNSRSRRWRDENSNKNQGNSNNEITSESGVVGEACSNGPQRQRHQPNSNNKRNIYHTVDTGTDGRMRSPLTVNKNQDIVSADSSNYHRRNYHPQQQGNSCAWKRNSAPAQPSEPTANMEVGQPGPQWINDVNEFPQLEAAVVDTAQSLCSWSSNTSESQSTTSASVSVVSDDAHLADSPQSTDLEMSPSSKVWLQMCLEYSASTNRSWVEELENEDNNDDVGLKTAPCQLADDEHTGASKTPRRRLAWVNDGSAGPSPSVEEELESIQDVTGETTPVKVTQSVNINTTDVNINVPDSVTEKTENADGGETAPAEISNADTAGDKMEKCENKIIAVTDKTIKIRQNLIDFAKNHWSYKNYATVVPRENRAQFFPQTPDKHQNISRRRFDSQLKSWRRYLHKWDNHAPTETTSSSVMQQTQADRLANTDQWDSEATVVSRQDDDTLTSAVNTMDTEDASCLSVMDTTEPVPVDIVAAAQPGGDQDESARDGFPECFSRVDMTGGDNQPQTNTQSSSQNPRSLFNLSPVNIAPVDSECAQGLRPDMGAIVVRGVEVPTVDLVINDDSMPSLF